MPVYNHTINHTNKCRYTTTTQNETLHANKCRCSATQVLDVCVPWFILTKMRRKKTLTRKVAVCQSLVKPFSTVAHNCHGKTILSDGKTKLTHGSTPLIHGKTELTHGRTPLIHGKTKLTHGKTKRTSWSAAAQRLLRALQMVCRVTVTHCSLGNRHVEYIVFLISNS